MSDLEKQAIEYFKNYSIWNQSQGFPRGKNDSAIETVLNLIEKQQEEIESAYWKGYTARDTEAQNICKSCKYRKT